MTGRNAGENHAVKERQLPLVALWIGMKIIYSQAFPWHQNILAITPRHVNSFTRREDHYSGYRAERHCVCVVSQNSWLTGGGARLQYHRKEGMLPSSFPANTATPHVRRASLITGCHIANSASINTLPQHPRSSSLGNELGHASRSKVGFSCHGCSFVNNWVVKAHQVCIRSSAART